MNPPRVRIPYGFCSKTFEKKGDDGFLLRIVERTQGISKTKPFCYIQLGGQDIRTDSPKKNLNSIIFSFQKQVQGVLEGTTDAGIW